MESQFQMLINQRNARVLCVVNPAPVSATSPGQGCSMVVPWLYITASLLLLPNLTREDPKFFLIHGSPQRPQCTDREGAVRAVGASWEEECNTCHCTETGNTGCTKLSCLPSWSDLEPKEHRSCTDADGSTREQGDSWKDDCNTCHCTEAGTVGCTKVLCGPKDLNTSQSKVALGDYCWWCYNGGIG